MKKKLLRVVPALALALPLLAQNREADRVRNAGKVMREILNAPDSIPQSVLDRADCVMLCRCPTARKICSQHFRKRRQ